MLLTPIARDADHFAKHVAAGERRLDRAADRAVRDA